jgi:hypothetical protein
MSLNSTDYGKHSLIQEKEKAQEQLSKLQDKYPTLPAPTTTED